MVTGITANPAQSGSDTLVHAFSFDVQGSYRCQDQGQDQGQKRRTRVSDPHSAAAIRLLILIEIEHVQDLPFTVDQ